MCGRFTLTDDNRERVAAMLGVPAEQLTEEDYRPRWNVAPTDPHWIVRMQHEDREALPAKWGLIQFGSKVAKRARGASCAERTVGPRALACQRSN